MIPFNTCYEFDIHSSMIVILAKYRVNFFGKKQTERIPWGFTKKEFMGTF